MISSSEHIVSLYQRYAGDWDRSRNHNCELFEKGWLDRFRALVPSGGSVLDIGCGSAEPIAAYLIGRGHAVTGIDTSPTMISISRSRFPAHHWLVHDMRALALGTRFQGVLAWDSFFHLTYEHQRAMFPIFAAHAAPGAPLMFTSGPQHGEAIGSFQGEDLYHASLDPAEYRTLLGANGFSVLAYVAEDPTCGRHTVWLAQRDEDR